MEKSKEKIINKIQNLLDLAKSDNEYEAFSAMEKARLLMAKHNISVSELETDIESEPTEKDVVNDTVFETSKRGIIAIAQVIANNFKCKFYYKNTKPIKLQFVGLNKDVEIAKEILTYAIIVAKKLAQRTIKDLKDRGESTTGAEQDYYVGFAKGLSECFKEQNKKEGQSFELALLVPTVVNNWLGENIKLKKGRTIKAHASESYSRGLVDGKSFNTKKIGN